jgi:hypothetical protein
MHTTTRQGQTLSVHLEAIHRVPGGHPEPIVVFRYPGGIECSAYYLSTFQAIPASEGLCLTGGTCERQELGPEAVAACQQHCDALMREVFS